MQRRWVAGIPSFRWLDCSSHDVFSGWLTCCRLPKIPHHKLNFLLHVDVSPKKQCLIQLHMNLGHIVPDIEQHLRIACEKISLSQSNLQT